MIDGIRFLLGWNKQRRQTLRNEVDLPAAINAHISWKIRLQAYVDGSSSEKLDPMVICCDDRCALGKWIHGDAVKHFGGSEDFQSLRAEHANFHFIAGNIVQKIGQGDKAGAELLLDNEYRHSSRKVIKVLTVLNDQINED